MNMRVYYNIFLLYSVLFLFYCSGTRIHQPQFEFVNSESKNIEIDSTLIADGSIDSLVAPYRNELDEKMNIVIGNASSALERGKPESPLNNFVADLMLKRAQMEFDKQVHVAITNQGGLRVNLPEGPINLRKIYELMPFENELVVLEMTSNQLRALAQEIGDVGGEPISGMMLEFLNGKLINIIVNDEEISEEQLYYVATTDYLSSPGRKRLKILGQVPRTFLGITLREAIVDEIKDIDASGKMISAQLDGRIKFMDSTVQEN